MIVIVHLFNRIKKALRNLFDHDLKSNLFLVSCNVKCFGFSNTLKALHIYAEKHMAASLFTLPICPTYRKLPNPNLNKNYCFTLFVYGVFGVFSAFAQVPVVSDINPVIEGEIVTTTGTHFSKSATNDLKGADRSKRFFENVSAIPSLGTKIFYDGGKLRLPRFRLYAFMNEANVFQLLKSFVFSSMVFLYGIN